MQQPTEQVLKWVEQGQGKKQEHEQEQKQKQGQEEVAVVEASDKKSGIQ
jgi:hypothetical protein